MCSAVHISFILNVVYQSFHVAKTILARNFSLTVININLDGVTYMIKIGELYMTIIRFFQ